jgi:hypothetical protein
MRNTRFRAQHVSWPFTSQGVKILTVLGQATTRKIIQAFSTEKKDTITEMEDGRDGVVSDEVAFVLDSRLRTSSCRATS